MVSYDEIVVQCRIDESGQVHATGTLEAGFEQMAVKHPEHIRSAQHMESGGCRSADPSGVRDVDGRDV